MLLLLVGSHSRVRIAKRNMPGPVPVLLAGRGRFPEPVGLLRSGIVSPQSVLDASKGVLCPPFDLVELALSLELCVPAAAADRLLHSPLGLFGGSRHTVMIDAV